MMDEDPLQLFHCRVWWMRCDLILHTGREINTRKTPRPFIHSFITDANVAPSSLFFAMSSSPPWTPCNASLQDATLKNSHALSLQHTPKRNMTSLEKFETGSYPGKINWAGAQFIFTDSFQTDFPWHTSKKGVASRNTCKKVNDITNYNMHSRRIL